MVDITEKDFEATIEGALVSGVAASAPGGLGVVAEGEAGYGQTIPGGHRKRTQQDYDRALCLDPGALFDFIYATQMPTWNRLKEQHGEQVKERFLKRLVKEIEERGTLHVLRKPVTDLGCKFRLAYFKPETTLNEEHRRLYNANVLSIVRQLHYSQTSDQSLDVAIFLNGLPIITAELKNPAKGQNVWHAVRQYKLDRDPKEPLFKFGRCLAHFAVDTDLVYMTTHLRGAKTHFLPFNKGFERGAGNPPNPNGFKTAYLWEDTWQRDGLLEILNHFLQMVDVLDDKGKKTGERKLIFPRYHQLDATHRMVRHAKEHGPGNQYLVEHSAGSGKSNTIAWLSHQLAGLHDAEDRRVFDSIIVITDRQVIDRQLQETVKSFEQVRGLVSTIEKGGKAKSTKLAEALAENKDIIVTTVQTFPFVQDKIAELPGQRFAVVIDEAHSSQTGETAQSVKNVLAVSDLDEAAAAEGAEPPSDQDTVNNAIEAMMKKRGRLPNVSFFAFTATPKNKTLELFGTPQPDGTFLPFSLYPMRQAIEEEFILDVLKNYTTFRVYFGMLKKIETDPKYAKKKGVYLLKSYAELHPHAIRQKAVMIVEHFRENVEQRIDGRAKAMVVTKSRLHAVKYKLAFDKHLRDTGAPCEALVAFSGTVKDPETGKEFTEGGMNDFPETQTAEQFKQQRYRFLIVAEKFQTGFDQPLLHTMYVDKKLSGVNAVQTLSRLNRIFPPHKDETMVLDFVNMPDDIRKTFQPYYEATVLTEATDPNKLYDLKRTIEEYHLYGQDEVDAFAKVYFSTKGTQEKLRAILDPVVQRYVEMPEEQEREFFRSRVIDYVRLYAFLSNILTFQDVELEKSYQFLRLLRPLLPVTREPLPVEITEQINMDSWRMQQTSTGDIALMSEDGELKPISEMGTGQPREDEKAPLSEIVEYMNEAYGTNFTSDDKVRYFAEDMERRMVEREGLCAALNPEINPSRESRLMAFDGHFSDVLEDMIEANFDIYKKVTEDENLKDMVRLALFQRVLKGLERKSA